MRIPRPLPLFLRLFFFLSSALAALGQSVHWEPPGGTLPLNQTSEVQLVFEGCEPDGDPAVPAVPGLHLQAVGRSSNMSIVNGRVSQTVVITYHARASQAAGVTIPAFAVKTDKGRLQVAAATYEVGAATVGQGNVALDRVANSTFTVPAQVWAGEVFNIEYALNVGRRYFHSPGTNVPEWTPAPLAVEDWGKPEVQESVVAGEQRVAIVYKTRGYAKDPGDVTLNAASQLVNLTTGSPSFGFFSRPNLEQYAITSSRPVIHVRALPAGAPPTFDGAVGTFKFESKVVPSTAAVGEPITWTLTLDGTGNWPDLRGLPSRDVSRDFRIVQPQARRTLKEGALFEGSISEDVVLIPTQPGTYQIGPVSWSYFDPQAGTYKTLTTERVTVQVSAPATPPRSASPFPGAASPEAEAAASGGSDAPRVAPPAPPQPLPTDPIAPHDAAPTPWSARTLTLALLSPLPAVLLLWMLLALKRARATDPHRIRREAHARLRLTLQELRSTSSPDKLHSLLQQWQRDAALLWEIPEAVPGTRHFETGRSEAERAAAQLWATLWRDTDRALYGARPLPADWVSRADAALHAKPVKRFSPFLLFRPGNLLPFAAALALLVLCAPPAVADAGRAAYDKGDFAAAEAAWRKEAMNNANDWSARHNLALALAQQNRWGEAAGYAASAFVQHPRAETVQWNLRLIVERAGFAPGVLNDFVAPSALHSLAQYLSPAEWQRFLVACACLAGAALALFLLVSFRVLGRWGNPLGTALLGLGLLGAIIGSVSLSLYGSTGDIRAAIVWKPSILRSVPTEADTTQKTSPLAPGSIALVDKTFLGWVRLNFPNGQTGWARQEDLVGLWR